MQLGGAMYRFLQLVDCGIIYQLSDADRAYSGEVFSSWSVANRNLAGGASITEGPKKKRWQLSWSQLPRDAGDDGGVGADTLEMLARQANRVYELREYTAENAWNTYQVWIASFSKQLVPESRRRRYSVSLTLEEV